MFGWRAEKISMADEDRLPNYDSCLTTMAMTDSSQKQMFSSQVCKPMTFITVYDIDKQESVM